MSEGRISARKDGSNVIVSKGPDVCLTPRGSAMVPVPYTSIAFLSSAARTSTSVRDNSNYDFQLNSRCATSTGHEQGTGKGVKVPGYLGMAHAKEGSSFFYSEGFAVVSHRDPAWINRPDPGGEEPKKGKQPVEFAANTTQNFKYACKVLRIDPVDASDALHAAKQAAAVPANGAYTFDLKTGDIFYGGEHIGNLRE